mgnify:CR=1 FL=1
MDVILPKNRDTGRSRGVGFVTFDTVEAAQAARRALSLRSEAVAALERRRRYVRVPCRRLGTAARLAMPPSAAAAAPGVAAS